MIYSVPFSTTGVANRLTTIVLDFQSIQAEGGRCHSEDGVRAGQSCLEGRPDEHITPDDLDLLLELLGLLRVGVTGDGTDLVLLGEIWFVQHIVDDRIALLTGSAKDGKSERSLSQGLGAVREDLDILDSLTFVTITMILVDLYDREELVKPGWLL